MTVSTVGTHASINHEAVEIDKVKQEATFVIQLKSHLSLNDPPQKAQTIQIKRAEKKVNQFKKIQTNTQYSAYPSYSNFRVPQC